MDRRGQRGKTGLVGLHPLFASNARADLSSDWDTAEMNLQVMDKLGIEKAFVLGTSQGGWICVRMALMAPERVHFSRTCPYRD